MRDEASSATRQARLEDLHEFLRDDMIDAVMAFVGGYAAVQLIEDLDYELVTRHPKLLIGYSDLTALQLAIYAKTGTPSVYGPAALPQFGESGGVDPYTWATFKAIVSGTPAPLPVHGTEEFTFEHLEWDVADERPRSAERAPTLRTVREGEVHGTLIAANLDTLLLLAGTEYLPPFDGVILALEVENTSTRGRVIRQLQQLKLIGCLSRIAGLVIGRLPPAVGMNDEELVVELLRVTNRSPVPIVMNVPFGHTDPIASLPIGGGVRLSAVHGQPSMVITSVIVGDDR
jgi:muramoyltetrapeptide carboxypeptidase